MLEGCVPWPDDLAERYRREGYWLGRSLGDLLQEACQANSERVAVVCGERRMTYGELFDQSTTLAQQLLDLGIRQLDRVMVQFPNVPEFATLVLALFRIGAIPVMALPGHRKVEVAHLCAHSGAVALAIMDQFCGFDYRQLAREAQQEVPSIKHVLVSGDAEEFTVLGAPPGRELTLPMVDPSEPALFLLSGGTTGPPKLIPRTHAEYAYNMLATAAALQVGPDSVYLAVNPVAHNSALGCPGLFGTLLVGGKVVLTSTARPDKMFALIRQEKVTFTTLVPATVRMWIDHALRSPVDLSGVLLQIGSSKLNPGQAEKARTVLGCQLSQWFGVGEGLLTYTRLDDPDEVVLNTVGRPLAAADEIRVADETDAPVPDGTDGELQVRGPYTIRGYYRAEEQNARSFTADGMFRTGDLVRRRPDGNTVVVGRIKDVINRGGDKVPAEEVEEHLLTHLGVRDVAVVGVQDPVLGELTYAYVVLRDHGLQLPSLKGFLRERGLATYKIPDKLVRVAELPRTPVGKADKVALRAFAGATSA